MKHLYTFLFLFVVALCTAQDRPICRKPVELKAAVDPAETPCCCSNWFIYKKGAGPSLSDRQFDIDFATNFVYINDTDGAGQYLGAVLDSLDDYENSWIYFSNTSSYGNFAVIEINRGTFIDMGGGVLQFQISVIATQGMLKTGPYCMKWDHGGARTHSRLYLPYDGQNCTHELQGIYPVSSLWGEQHEANDGLGSYSLWRVQLGETFLTTGDINHASQFRTTPSLAYMNYADANSQSTAQTGPSLWNATVTDYTNLTYITLSPTSLRLGTPNVISGTATGVLTYSGAFPGVCDFQPLPQGVAVPDAIGTVTVNDFNNLLNSLRGAGIIAP